MIFLHLPLDRLDEFVYSTYIQTFVKTTESAPEDQTTEIKKSIIVTANILAPIILELGKGFTIIWKISVAFTLLTLCVCTKDLTKE